MVRDWEILVDYFAGLQRVQNAEHKAFYSALNGIEQVARVIAAGHLKHALFGWTSMYDLCVQQTGHEPYSVSHLRISPQAAGMLEFRYLDTAIAERQWSRTVAAEQATTMFLKFLDQLHWVADSRSSIPISSSAD